LRDVFPPDSAPRGKEPVGVKPFNCRTLSLSSLKGNKQLFVSSDFHASVSKVSILLPHIPEEKLPPTEVSLPLGPKS